MKTIFSLCFIFLFNYSYSQNKEIEHLINIKNELELQKEKINDSIEKIELLINNLKPKGNLAKLEFDKNKFTIIKPLKEGKIKDTPNPKGIPICSFNENDKIKVFTYIDGYWFVEKNNIFGYIHNSFFENDVFMDEIVNVYKENQIKEKLQNFKQEESTRKQGYEEQQLAQQREQIKKDEERKKMLITKYGQTNGEKIFYEKIWIGMTEEMLYESWGQPESINRTVSTYGVHKQCIYGSTYVYIEDGIVTSWQDKL